MNGECGTRRGYQWHIRHRETPCDACAEAAVQYQRRYRKERIAPRPEPPRPVVTDRLPVVIDPQPGSRSEWRESANCQGADPDAFFPPDDDNHGHRYAAAKRVCANCTVMDECLAFAVGHGIADGVWGGLAPRERKAMRQAQARIPYDPDDPISERRWIALSANDYRMETS